MVVFTPISVAQTVFLSFYSSFLSGAYCHLPLDATVGPTIREQQQFLITLKKKKEAKKAKKAATAFGQVASRLQSFHIFTLSVSEEGTKILGVDFF